MPGNQILYCLKSHITRLGCLVISLILIFQILIRMPGNHISILLDIYESD